MQTDLPVGIKYPERAEGVSAYKDYKVFVEFWDPLVKELSEYYRRLVVRRETRVLGIYGPQGSGKTMFSAQLLADFANTKASLTREVKFDNQNVWHRITGGTSPTSAHVTRATADSDIRKLENDNEWVDSLINWVAPVERNCIAIADNAESFYFLRGLAGQSASSGDRHEPALLTVAAERLVRLARTDLSGIMLILLSNDCDYLQELQKKVESQHRGLMRLAEIPLPSAPEKERAVRVNINRLNGLSYWYCLDRGGLPQKKEVHRRLTDATTFPETFEAVDEALQSGLERTGRPPRRNLLTLVCLSGESEVDPSKMELASGAEVEAASGWAVSLLHDKGWASPEKLTDRGANLLESEWQMRLVVLGAPFVAALLHATEVGDSQPKWADGAYGKLQQMLEVIQQPLGPTSQLRTRKRYAEEIRALAYDWVSVPDEVLDGLGEEFWSRGQQRSVIYEPLLTKLLNGTYNVGTPGFLSARPDYVVKDYTPCSVLTATSLSPSHLNTAIQRNAHAMEFTAQQAPTAASLQAYLSTKLPNYLTATQDQ